MVQLAEFPLEVVESLAPFLKDHHLARLWMTGDACLQRTLERIRRRSCHMTDNDTNSTLVRRFIVGMAMSVETPLSGLDLVGLKNRRVPLVSLTIDTRGDRNRTGALDLSCLTTLERLRIGKGYSVNSQLSLPTSIVSVDISFIQSGTPIVNLAFLHRLEELTIGSFDSCNCCNGREINKLFESAAELKSLRILRAPTGLRPNGLGSSISPLNLVELFLTVSQAALSFELSSFVKNQFSIKTIGIIHGEVTIAGPLPRSVTTIMLGQLDVLSGSTAVDTFRLFPPSLTHLSFNSITGPLATSRFVDGDLQDAYMEIFPQLTLESMERLLSASTGVFMLRTVEFMGFLMTMSVQHGMASDYLLSSDLPKWRLQISRSHMALILASAESEKTAIDMINERKRVAANGFYRDATVNVNGHYQRHCIRLLELGVTDILDLSPELRFKKNGLSQSAICNLATVNIYPSTLGVFRQLLSTTTLSCLRRIEVVIIDVDLTQVMTMIHEHASSLPSLEEIVLHPLSNIFSIPDELLNKIASDMNLFLLNGESRLIFSVSPTSAAKRAMNPLRIARRVLTCALKGACGLFLVFATATLVAGKIKGLC